MRLCIWVCLSRVKQICYGQTGDARQLDDASSTTSTLRDGLNLKNLNLIPTEQQPSKESKSFPKSLRFYTLVANYEKIEKHLPLILKHQNFSFIVEI